jgi:hypothetical protein
MQRWITWWERPEWSRPVNGRKHELESFGRNGDRLAGMEPVTRTGSTAFAPQMTP